MNPGNVPDHHKDLPLLNFPKNVGKRNAPSSSNQLLGAGSFICCNIPDCRCKQGGMKRLELACAEKSG